MDTDIASATALRVTCSRDELASSLGIVARGLSSRNAVQVLTGILLQADEEKLTLAATDMELSLRTTLDAQVDGDAFAREHLIAIKRAGADFVLTYLARELAERLS